MAFRILIFVFFAASMLSGCYVLTTNKKSCDIAVNGKLIFLSVPIARTMEEQQAGLSNRADISSGMFFTWRKADIRQFWMKDTIKPISVGFIDSDNKLFQIETMKQQSLSMHFSIKKALAALELPEGAFQAAGIKIGDTITCE